MDEVILRMACWGMGLLMGTKIEDWYEEILQTLKLDTHPWSGNEKSWFNRPFQKLVDQHRKEYIIP